MPHAAAAVLMPPNPPSSVPTPAGVPRPSGSQRSTRPGFEGSRDYMQSLARGIVVLRTLDGENARMTMAGIAGRSGLSRAAVRRIILTLQHMGYVRAHGREYAVTPRVLELGVNYVAAHGLADVVDPGLEELSRRLGAGSALAVLDGREVVTVAHAAMRRVAPAAPVLGTRLPASCTASGRVLLAALSADGFDDWLRRAPSPRRMPATVVDPVRLQGALDEVRGQGFAFVEQECDLGVSTLALPVHTEGGRTCAALTVSLVHAAEARVRALRDVAPLMRDIVAAIERNAPPDWLPAVGE